MQPHRGVMLLVFGILSLVMCMPFMPLGIAAMIMGRADLRAMDRGEMDPAGRSLSQAGVVLGIISMVFAGLMLMWFAFVAFVMLVVATTAHVH